MRTSSRPARARRRYHSAVMVGRWAPGCLPTMIQGLMGAADPRQHRFRRGCERHHAGARLAVAEAKLACGAVHIVPAKGEDLVQPAAGEHEEAERGDGVGRDRALPPAPRPPLQPRPCLSAGTPRGRGSARAFSLCICGRRGRGWCRPARGPRRRRARTSWRGPPARGWRRGVSRAAGSAAPRRGRARPGQAASCRAGQDVVLQRAPVDACGVRIAVLCDVGAHVALGEVGDGGAGLGQEWPGSSPRLMRSMTWAARLRAWWR